MKTCPVCKVEKLTSEFHKRTRAKDGRALWCKLCVKAYGKARYPLVVDRMREQGRAYRAANKPAIAAAAKRLRERDAEKIRADKRAYYLANKEAIKAKVQQWAIDNPERARERQQRYYRETREVRLAASRAWRERNPDKRLAAKARRRIREQDRMGTVRARDLARLLHHYRHECAYCSAPLGEGFHWDHVIPLSRGGRHGVGNLVPACATCNYAKGYKFLSEWKLRKHTHAA